MELEKDADDEVESTNEEKDEDYLLSRQQWSSMKTLPDKGEEDRSLEGGEAQSLEEVEDKDEEEIQKRSNRPLSRTRRTYSNIRRIRLPHDGQSPHTVAYAANYNEQENKGWVKPLFSSIVYRLPVKNCFLFPSSVGQTFIPIIDNK